MNNVKTKLKKNYLALAIAIAVLGVISATLLTTNSFAESTSINNNEYTYHITGTVKDYKGNVVDNAEVNAASQTQGVFSTYTDTSGNFDLECTTDQSSITIIGMSIRKAMSGYRLEWTYHDGDIRTFILDGNKNFGTITCWYVKEFQEYVNNIPMYRESEWTQGTILRDAEFFDQENKNIINGGLYEIEYYEMSSSIIGSVITINVDKGIGWGPHGPSIKKITFTAQPVSGYYTDSFYLGNDLEVAGGAAVFAIFKPGTPPTPKHVVTFNENISKVLTNGVEIASGTEVEEGANLQIIPAVAVEKVTKVYVNDSVCPACQTTVNSDIYIKGQMYDSVKLSGKVVTEEEHPDAFKAVSKLFVGKYYGAGLGVESASVTFTDAIDGWYTSTVSDSNGEFELDVVRGNAGMLTVSKDGYETYTKEIDGVDLEDDYVINPILKSVNTNPENNISTNSATQTGDSIQLLAVLIIAAIVSSFVFLFRNNYKAKGKHIK